MKPSWLWRASATEEAAALAKLINMAPEDRVRTAYTYGGPAAQNPGNWGMVTQNMAARFRELMDQLYGEGSGG